MMFKYVFLLGRPGCGKSALYRVLEKRLLQSGQAKTFERVDDFPKLWARFQADDVREHEGKERTFTRRISGGNYQITNRDILKDVMNEVLGEVSSDLLKIDKPDLLVFIEFARSKYVEALGKFAQSILHNCIIVYMDVSFETCWARNVARNQATIDAGGYDHLVPREEMEKLYLYDDRDALVRTMKDQTIPVLVVNNEIAGEERLEQQVDVLLTRLF